MTDPLKLPLRVRPCLDNGLYLYVEDGRGHPVKLTKHQRDHEYHAAHRDRLNANRRKRYYQRKEALGEAG